VGAMVDGKPNYMPAAFLSIANYKPPKVACGLNAEHKTCRGIVEQQVKWGQGRL
jgi:flavin reductase (DIM6/NTAB) family NADH-FMN oxidoreductase RutF